MLLAHGAGAPMDSEWMDRFAAGVAERGVPVVRFEFPYMHRQRQSGKRRGPDQPHVLAATWREAVDHWSRGAKPFVGGKSMGGRIASMIADAAGVAGLVCVGYPFHPPGRPEKLRTEHLAPLVTPTLILQGTRDPFGTPEQVGGYELSLAIRVQWLEDGDHSLKPRVKSGRTLAQNLAEAMDATAEFIAAQR